MTAASRRCLLLLPLPALVWNGSLGGSARSLVGCSAPKLGSARQFGPAARRGSHLQDGGQLGRQVAESLLLLADALADAAFVGVQLAAVGGQSAALLQLPVQPRQVATVRVVARRRLAEAEGQGWGGGSEGWLR